MHCWQCSEQLWQEEHGAAGSITVVSATSQQDMGCAFDVWGRDRAAPWEGEMRKLVQGVHWDMTQGAKGAQGLSPNARLTLPQTISMGMLPSLGMWLQCQHNTVGLCCGDSPVLA